MRTLGVIPARGGSKGIPGKNLVPLLGRPLIAWTIEAARASRSLDRVVVSTDDEEIARVARACGAQTPFLRPGELARDDTPILPVLQHVIATLADQDSAFDIVVLLQPTSPLRRAQRIDEAVDLLVETGADSVVSVVEVPHQFNPVSVMALEGGRLVPFLSNATVTRRQDKPRLFGRNGPAVLATRTTVLLDQDSLYGRDCRPLIMPADESPDIDAPWDLELVEWLLGRQRRESLPASS